MLAHFSGWYDGFWEKATRIFGVTWDRYQKSGVWFCYIENLMNLADFWEIFVISGGFFVFYG